jgi:hypothetical protein
MQAKKQMRPLQAQDRWSSILLSAAAAASCPSRRGEPLCSPWNEEGRHRGLPLRRKGLNTYQGLATVLLVDWQQYVLLIGNSTVS